ncbi:hypothetical protein [Longimicrobium sp.]|uniref:hypothetical protein n=1 Tax=Longimicrobium sp. TaxID=2029185 RepID=UPI002B683588|nr:hypothetical protein [Longimicrobium sp.]HSU15569.1 hypothetical protein [Longimicrobium sp.]
MAHSGDFPARVPFRRLSVSGAAWGGMALLVLVGVAAAVLGEHERMWLAVHYNWLFWSSVAVGMVLFAISQQLTNSRWSWPLRRIALAGIGFFPVSFVLFLLKLPGRPVWFEHWWGEGKVQADPILAAKAVWLSPTGMLLRDLIGLLVLYGMMAWFAYHMLRPDLHGVKGPGIYRTITGGEWRGVAEEALRSRKLSLRIGAVTAILNALIWGMIAIDQAMTMLPHWFSTMFPVTFLVSTFHSGLAMTAVMMVVLRRHLKLEEYITGAQFHDLGKLIFAFAVFWMYVNWSQYVVIWYGQLPHEQEFFVQRFHPQFALITEIMVACVFVFPFLALLPRAPKKVPGVLAGVSAVVVIGHWLERYLITIPSVWGGSHAPFGLTEIGISLGFAGLFFASYAWFLSTFPVLPSPASLATIPSPTITVPVRAVARS